MNKENKRSSFDKEDIEDIIALTPMQEGMLFHYLEDPLGDVYFEQLSLDIIGDIDTEKFERAWTFVIESNDMLRTVFRWEKVERSLQIVLKKYDFQPRYFDGRAPGGEDRDGNKRLEEIKKRDRQEKFDLRVVPFRVTLFKKDRGRYVMIISNHHILYDGWSNGIILNEFFQAYENLSSGKPLSKISKTGFKEFVRWYQEQCGEKDKQEIFWKNYLSGFDEPARLSIKGGNGDNRESGQGQGKVNLSFSGPAKETLEDFLQENKLTLASLLYSAWGLLLQTYHNSSDVIFGTTVSGRSGSIKVKEIENIVGLFINTLPLRIKSSSDEKTADLLTRVNHELQQRGDFESTSLVQIKEWCGFGFKEELFDTIVVMENYPLAHLPQKQGRENHKLHVDSYSVFEMSSFDLTLGVLISEDIEVNFSYNRDRFNDDEVNRIAGHFRCMVESILENPGEKIVDLEVLTGEEKHKILVEFNEPLSGFFEEPTIHERFSRQVEQTPDAVALYDGGHIACRELDQRSGRLAGELIERGVKPGAIVGIMLERSIDMIIGILGVLKLGGAYLPIDPGYPEARIDFMLEDCGVKWLLTDRSLTKEVEKLRNFKRRKNSGIIFIDSIDSANFLSSHQLNVSTTNSNSSDPAYIIYTSGSTGKPKGVVIEHGSVVSLVKNPNFIDFEKGDRLLMTGAIVFDVTTFEIWGPLLNGLGLYLVEDRVILDLGELRNAVIENNISILHLIPQLFNQLVIQDQQLFAGLRYFLIGGDLVSPRFVNIISNRYKSIKIIHLYGPTENTTFSTYFPVEKSYETAIPIGKPIQESTAYIVNQHSRLQPVGVAGELWVGGRGVARGYLNQPELTAAKFVYKNNKTFLRGFQMLHGRFLQKEPPGRRRQKIYKTGDIARWICNGNIEFLGRKDHQVKIRGHRIELGEIETKILTQNDIHQTIVIDRVTAGGDRHLCAYVVPETGKTIDLAGIKKSLARMLPDYMIPMYWEQLEKIPLTSNGKVDRRALPGPEIRAAVEYAPPRDEGERKLVGIWADILELERERIGINHNFFEIGGHSLRAVRLAARIHKEFNVKLSLREIFAAPIIKEISRIIKKAAVHGHASLKAVEKKEYYILSSAQQRLYFLSRMESGSVYYNIPAAFILEGEINPNRWEESLQRLIERHQSLRTSFFMKGEEVLQRIHEHVEFNVDYDDWGDSRTEADLIKEFIRPFDLGRAPLLRVGLRKIRQRKSLLMIDIHHIISDGVSTGILCRELAGLQRNEELPALHLQYRDYAQWQKNVQARGGLRLQESYWLNRFPGDIPVLNLPYDYPRPKMQDFKGRRIYFKLSQQQVGDLNELAAGQDTSLYMVILTVFNILLSKWSGQEEIVVGTPLAGRSHVDLEPIVGMFVNTLPLQHFPHGHKSFTGFLREVSQKTLEAFENQDYPFEELVDRLLGTPGTMGTPGTSGIDETREIRRGITRLPRDTSRNPLFDVVLSFQDQEFTHVQVPGVTMKTYPLETGASKFDLTLQVMNRHDELDLSVEYCTALFKEKTLQRFTSYFTGIIDGVLRDPLARIGEIEIITEIEKKWLLYDFNDTSAGYPENKVIHRLFEKQVEQGPDKVAVIGPVPGSSHTFSVTYEELNRQANRAACLLRELGVTPVMIAALLVERSIGMIYGILAILKAGGAYMPIEPGYPAERINYMLEDSRAGLILIDRNLENKVTVGRKLIFLEELESSPAGAEDAGANLENLNCPRDLAYIIYTSGTTGQPKGALVDHRNLVRLMINDRFLFDFSGDDVWTMFHSYCFDFSVWEMYGALLYGGRLVVISQPAARDPRRYLEILKQNRVTVLNQTPAAFYNLAAEELAHTGNHLALRYVIFGGEALSPVKLGNWKETYPEVLLVNMFGITETTVHVTYKEIGDKEITANISSIGKPIPTLSVYIMDKFLKLVPRGTAGELCVGGDGVGRGYLNRVELTGEKFVENPYKRGETLYRSGDLARLLENHDLEYLGRLDRQVKIRGFRIELGEIENQLQRFHGVKEALLMIHQDPKGDKFLCAYIVPRPAESGNANAVAPLKLSALREHLSARLPAYMVPAYFVTLEKFPLTPNGKVDRKALPRPGETGLTGDVQYAGAGNTVEKRLVETWEQVLGRSRIGIDDNFFELGGDSIKTIQIAARMNQVGWDVEVKDIFRNPTIRELAPFVKELERVSDQSAITGTIPLTPIQYWFFESEYIDGHHFNQSVMLRASQRIDLVAVREIYTRIQEHHDALRITFKTMGPAIIQENQGLDFPLFLREFDFRNREPAQAMAMVEAAAEEIQAGIDLEKGPLMRLALFHLDDGDRLLMVIHHLVIDTVSWRILLEDIQALFLRYSQGKPLTLPLKTDSYQRWARELSGYAGSPASLKEKTYWSDLETAAVSVIPEDLPGNNFGDNSRQDETRLDFRLESQESRDLLTAVNRAFGTEINDILVTALGISIKKTFGISGILIALEGHGREDIITNINISRTVGWFTSIFPVVLNISYEHDLSRQIKEVKETLHRVPGKGIGYGILKYLTPVAAGDDITPGLEPQVCFNYLGQFDQDTNQLFFSIANEHCGSNQSPRQQRKYKLDIVAAVRENQLEVAVTYSRKQYKQQTIAGFLNRFQAELSTIISYCMDRTQREYSPVDFSYTGLTIEQVERLCREYSPQDIYTLTPMQEGMLFHALYNPDSSAYFVQTSSRFYGHLEVEPVKRSLQELFKRHEILRTAFTYQGISRPVQVVLNERQPVFFYQDLRHIPGTRENREAVITRFKETDRARKFDLSKDVLLRAAVFQVDDTEFEFTWSFHHILMDGWGVRVLGTEFFKIYNSFLENKPYALPAVTPYHRYIRWLENQNKEKAQHYWKNLLEGYKEAVGIPKKETGSAGNRAKNEYQREESEFLLSREKTEHLQQLAAGNRITLSVIFQAIWAVMLANYNNKQDVVFGIVVSGRPKEIKGVESMIGLFINTVPVRIRLETDTTFTALLRQIQDQAINSESYHYYSLAEIQAQSYLKQQLLDHFLTFLNYPEVERIEGTEKPGNNKNPGFEISGFASLERSNYDLDILIYFERQIKFRLRYNTIVYSSDFMKKLASHIEEVSDQIIADNDINVADIVISHDRLVARPLLPPDDDGDFDL